LITVFYLKEIHCLKFSATSSNKASLLDGASSSLKAPIELASEKGASNWLTVLPLQEHNFSLQKTVFHDAVALRYGWDPTRLSQHCAYGKVHISLLNILLCTCPKSGFLSIHLNVIMT